MTCRPLSWSTGRPNSVVVIRAAAGSRVFSAGHDVHELPTNGRDPLTYNDPLRKVIRNVETYPAPIIAMVEGSVWGGACELVLSCDLVVAASGVTFALTPLGWEFRTTSPARSTS